MHNTKQFETVTEALKDLQLRGFIYDFDWKNPCYTCDDLAASYHPEEMTIVEVYRFEGMNDPADSAVVYAVETSTGHKGIIVDGYGADADELKTEFISKIKIK